MTVQQAKPLNGYHQRKPRSHQRTHVPVNGHLPPAATLKALRAPAKLVAQVRTWHNLVDAERDHARKAAAANTAAEAATAAYRRAVREAIAAGKAPDKVQDETEKHKAIAKAHVQFSADARAERERLGYTLGPQLEAIAPDLFAAAEADIEKQATVLRETLAGIRGTWANYSEAFQTRVWLSNIALNGGATVAWHGATGLPAQAAAAIDALDHNVTEVDRLKDDENQVTRFRSDNP